MTVYVDDARKPFGRMLMCHLVADWARELHDTADLLGIDRRYFHRGHYNICQSKHQQAIELGAIPISQREAAKIRRAFQ